MRMPRPGGGRAAGGRALLAATGERRGADVAPAGGRTAWSYGGVHRTAVHAGRAAPRLLGLRCPFRPAAVPSPRCPFRPGTWCPFHPGTWCPPARRAARSQGRPPGTWCPPARRAARPGTWCPPARPAVPARPALPARRARGRFRGTHTSDHPDGAAPPELLVPFATCKDPTTRPGDTALVCLPRKTSTSRPAKSTSPPARLSLAFLLSKAVLILCGPRTKPTSRPGGWPPRPEGPAGRRYRPICVEHRRRRRSTRSSSWRSWPDRPSACPPGTSSHMSSCGALSEDRAAWGGLGRPTFLSYVRRLTHVRGSWPLRGFWGGRRALFGAAVMR
jgi:hypothetical protein